MADLKKEAFLIVKQDGQNYKTTLETVEKLLSPDLSDFSGSIVPSSDNTYSLGSPDRQWKDIHVSGGTIYLGGIGLSEQGGSLHIEKTDPDPGDPAVTFDLSENGLSDLGDVNTHGAQDAQVLKYDQDSGEWRPAATVSGALTFHGLIGSDADAGEHLVPSGDEVEGDFFLVNETTTLNPGGQQDWPGLADDLVVDSADMVVLGQGSKWFHLDDVIGGTGVTQIISDTDALVVDENNPAQPRLSITNATTSTDGLMSSQDKTKLDEVDDTYVAVEGDTMTGPLEIIARDEILENDNMFSVLGQQANNRNGQHLFRAIKKDDGDGDQVRYYGPVKFSQEITTKEYVDQAIADSAGDEGSVRDILQQGAYPAGFASSRKLHNSLYDAESGVLFSYRCQDNPASWHDNVKFSCAVTDTLAEAPDLRTKKISEEYKTGNNNEYISLTSPIKWKDGYVLFPANRPFDQSLVIFKPNAIDADGYKGDADNFPNNQLLFAEEACNSINTATPLTSDHRYVIVAGQDADRLPNAGPNTDPKTWIVDLQNVEDDIEYKTFDRAYSGSGGGSENRRAAAKPISLDSGGYGAAIEKQDGTNTVYLFQAGQKIKKVVINDLGTLDVTLQDIDGTDLPFSFYSVNGGRVSYKGRLSGITVYQNRYIIFFAQNVGIYSFDTTDESLTLIHDTSTSWLRYGLMRYDYNRGVPEVQGNLYFVPNSATGPDSIDYDTKVLVVSEHEDEFTITEFPFDIPGFGSDYSVKSGPYNFMVFNNNESGHELPNGGETIWSFDVLTNKLTTITLPSPVYSGTPYRGGGLILTPNAKMSAPNKWNYRTADFYAAGDGLDSEIVANTDFSQNAIIQGIIGLATENHDIATNNEDAIVSLEDGLNDIVNPHLKIITEDKSFVNSDRLEHQYPLYITDETDPYYHLTPQRFVLLARFWPGNKGTNTVKWQEDYGDDGMNNAVIMDLITGKTLDISVSTELTGGKKPPLRGGIVKSRQDGSLDIYFWIHNPLRTMNSDGAPCPLFRIHVPSESDIIDADPFLNFTYGYTNIRMEQAKFTYPNKNPYYKYDGNINDNDGFQYNILPYPIIFKDSADSGTNHYFYQSGPDAARDYATQRIMEVFFDESDPDEGVIEPVIVNAPSNEDTAWGYIGGSYLIKSDLNGIDRCFVHSNPLGIAELFFVNSGGVRKGKVRVHPGYTPQGDRVTHISKRNKLGHPLIIQKGIDTNQNKGDWSAIQWLNRHELDPNDEWDCTILYHAYDFGVVAIDMRAIIARNENVLDEYANYTRLINNYHGDLNCMHIYDGDSEIYKSYMLQDTVKNMMRFNTQLIDAHGSGSVWFFDWKPGYVEGSADQDNFYNSNTDYVYKRGTLEVRVNPLEDMIEVIGHSMGRKNINTGVESVPFEIGAQGLCKMYGNTFVMSNANNTGHINDPKYCLYDTSTKSLSLLSAETSAGLSPIAVNDLGIVSFGNNGGTKMFCVDMLSESVELNSRLDDITSYGVGATEHPEFGVKRKVHASMYDEESGVLLSFRSILGIKNWNDYVKFNFLITDTYKEDLVPRTGKVKTQYKSGGNNEYISMSYPIKWKGDYVFFPENRVKDGQLGIFKPKAQYEVFDEEGNVIETHRGTVDAFPLDMVLSKENCNQVNSVSPLTADNRYCIITGAELDHLPGTGPQTGNYVGIVDLQNAENGTPFETFDGGTEHRGDGEQIRKAHAKTVTTDSGGQCRHIENEDGTKTVYIFQAAQPIKKVVVNDLANLDVTLEDVSVSLPFSYLIKNNGRVSYKGKVDGLTVFQNRYIVFHSSIDGTYSFDTTTDTLTKIHDTSDDKLRYGMMKYRKEVGVPEVNGKLYYVPNFNKAEGSFSDEAAPSYPTKLLVVDKDLNVEEIPFEIPDFSCDFSTKWGSDKIVMFDNTILGDQVGGNIYYVYDTIEGEFTKLESDTPAYSATSYKDGELIFTPNTRQSTNNQWDYPLEQFLVTGDALDEVLLEKSNLLKNSKIRELDTTVDELQNIITELTARIAVLEAAAGQTSVEPDPEPEYDPERPVDP